MLFEEILVKQIFLGDEGKNQNHLGHQEFITVETVFEQDHNSTRSNTKFCTSGLHPYYTKQKGRVSSYVGLFLKGHFEKL